MVLTDFNSSSPLSDKQVNFIINNVNYTATTNSNGVASINLDLNTGKYAAFAYFAGDDSHHNSSLNTTISILSTIKANDITKYYKGSTPFTAQFFDSQGNALANRAVNIIINGKSYTKQTNSNGFVSIAVNLKPGSYKIISTDPITGLQLTTTFKILSTISSSNVKQVAGQKKKFKVKFFKSNGKVLAKKYVKYKIKGKTHKVKTNSKGKISFSLKKFKKGTYKIVCYNRDGLSKTYKVKIYKKKASTKLTAKSYTFFSNDAKEIKVKLSTALADSSNAGKTVKIKINGKTYSKKTDSNGIVYLKLSSFKKGLYKMKVSYSGNKFFKSSKSTAYVTILDTTNTSLTVKSTTSFGYGAGTSFKLLLTAGGVPLINKVVKLNINGKTYSKTTNAKGIVSLPISLSIGKYDVSYKFDGDSYLNGTSGDCEIEVFKRSSSKFIWKCGSSYKDSSQTFKVLLTDSNGNPISKGVVKLTIDGKTYTATTSSNGFAKFKTSVALGKYKISVKFNGNNNFLSSKGSKNIKVKLSKFSNGINQKGASYLKAYLKSSSNCKVGTAKLKKLVKTLTKGKHNKIDKAKAIFNYVRDHISYSFYSNTYRGSGGTLHDKKGNCVDMAHLIVAMYRTAGFNARYVHGKCKFISSGHVYGHVWAQVKIGKYWVCADTTSYKNQLGKVCNWNTKSYKIHAKYASLPF